MNEINNTMTLDNRQELWCSSCKNEGSKVCKNCVFAGMPTRYEFNSPLKKEKLPKRRDEYTLADINLLSIYEYIVTFDVYFTEWSSKYHICAFSKETYVSFDEVAVQKRFLEALNILGLSYSEWDKSNLSDCDYAALYSLLFKKLNKE